MNLETTPASGSASRRDFIKTGTSLAAAAGLTSTLSRSVHAAQDSKIRVALIGCGAVAEPVPQKTHCKSTTVRSNS
jgi:hypothetical protein